MARDPEDTDRFARQSFTFRRMRSWHIWSLLVALVVLVLLVIFLT